MKNEAGWWSIGDVFCSSNGISSNTLEKELMFRSASLVDLYLMRLLLVITRGLVMHATHVYHLKKLSQRHYIDVDTNLIDQSTRSIILVKN